MRDAGEVKRLHTVDTIHAHSIARHTYGAQIVALELCRENNVPVGMVLWKLLLHDAPEISTGDIPAPVKRASTDLSHILSQMELEFFKTYSIWEPQLSETENIIVRASDTIDLAFACLHERRYGNNHSRLEVVFHNCMKYLDEYPNVKGVRAFRTYLEMEWRNEM